MEGITMVLLAFIFLCIAYPQMIRNRPQFFASVGLVLVIIFLTGLSAVFSLGGRAHAVVFFILCILQIGTVLTLIMSAGGQSPRELMGEMHKTIDLVRRGGESETIIVPLTGEQPKSKE